MTGVFISDCGGFGREVNMLCGQVGLRVPGTRAKFVNVPPVLKRSLA